MWLCVCVCVYGGGGGGGGGGGSWLREVSVSAVCVARAANSFVFLSPGSRCSVNSHFFSSSFFLFSFSSPFIIKTQQIPFDATPNFTPGVNQSAIRVIQSLHVGRQSHNI